MSGTPPRNRRLTPEQQALAAKWVRLAWRYARRYAHLGFDASDLAAEGCVGLCEAARRFDASRGLLFPTYARHWILAMIRVYCSVNRSPFGKRGRAQQKIAALVREIDAAEEEHGDGSLVAVAERHGLDPQEVALVLNRGHGVYDLGDWRENYMPQLIETTTPEDIAICEQGKRELSNKVQSALSSLDLREAMIMRRRLMVDKCATLADIGSDLGVSRERVRQLEARAIGKLRARLGQA